MNPAGTADAVGALHERGYVVVDDVLDPGAVLDPVLDAAARQVSAYAERDRLAGRLPRSYAADPLAEQLVALVGHGATWIGEVLDVSLPQGGIRPDTPMFLDPAAFALLACPGLLDTLEAVLGPRIWLSPVGHTRAKVPHRFATGRLGGMLDDVPWHQDNGVLLAEADDVDILTVWIPLVDVDETNGCLQVLPTPWRAALLDHCPGTGGLTIPDRTLSDRTPQPVPMRRGGVLLLHSRTVHASLPNRTPDQVRLSMDLRYQACAQPNGRPAFPSFLLRGSAGADTADAAAGGGAVTGPGGGPISFADWRDGWSATRERLAARELGPFNRWDGNAPACA